MTVSEYILTRVFWYPHGGEPVMIEGEFVNNWGVPTLACAIEEILAELGIKLPYEDIGQVQREVNTQLACHPWAVIACSHGKARLELVSHAETSTFPRP
jgi:hypothetical protein